MVTGKVTIHKNEDSSALFPSPKSYWHTTQNMLFKCMKIKDHEKEAKQDICHTPRLRKSLNPNSISSVLIVLIDKSLIILKPVYCKKYSKTYKGNNYKRSCICEMNTAVQVQVCTRQSFGKERKATLSTLYCSLRPNFVRHSSKETKAIWNATEFAALSTFRRRLSEF